MTRLHTGEGPVGFGPDPALALRAEPASGLVGSRVDPGQGVKVHGLGVGKSDDWFTPASVFDALSCQFDLDVAAPESGPLHVPCSRWIWRDSLNAQWSGFVWMNPPFGGRGALVPWMDKFFDHGNGIALTPDRTSAPWFHAAWPRADAVLFGRRTRFLRADGKPLGCPAFGTTLWATGPKAVEALRNAAASGFGLLTTGEPRRAA